MRTYAQDSGQSVARILTLAMMSDGKLAPEELEVLSRREAFARVGISEQEFLAVMQEFCDDVLARTQPSEEECVLDLQQIRALLDSVNDPVEQRAACELMLHIIRADGRLHSGESMIFWEALDRWSLSLHELRGAATTAAQAASDVHQTKHRTRRRRLYRRMRPNTN
jgi:uncharacterized tellurite resistance protein B-like protein